MIIFYANIPAMLSYETMAYRYVDYLFITLPVISLSDPHSNELKHWLFLIILVEITFDDNHEMKRAQANGTCLRTCQTL